jgi:hypothetical protein
MSNPVSPVASTTAVSQTAPIAGQTSATNSKTPPKTSAVPKDTVTLTQPAKQAPATSTTPKTSGDVDRDGDNH